MSDRRRTLLLGEGSLVSQTLGLSQGLLLVGLSSLLLLLTCNACVLVSLSVRL